MVPAEPFGADQFRISTGASEEAVDALTRYRGLIAEWSERFNLVGPSVLADFWPRHAYDSAQLLSLSPPAAVRWADLGSGAGFPGVVLSVLLQDRPGARVHLVESNAKRRRFLDAVVDALALPAEVHHARAETLALEVDVVTARACAPLDRLLAFAEPYLTRGAVGLFLKGSSAEAELTAARRSWKVDADLLPSLSDPSGRIVRVKGLSRV